MSSLTSGRGLHAMTFQTENVTHGSSNDVIAIGEGCTGTARVLLAMRYYACVVDHPPSIGALAGS
jgi:hypothetical protein